MAHVFVLVKHALLAAVSSDDFIYLLPGEARIEYLQWNKIFKPQCNISWKMIKLERAGNDCSIYRKTRSPTHPLNIEVRWIE